MAPTAQNELLAAALCKGKVSSGSQQQPQRASAQESNASRFRPPPSALQRAKRGGAAPGSLGPVSLLGVSDARNPLPTGSPCLGSRIGRAKPFCAQAAAMPPEPARPLSAESPSHRRAKTSFWQLHCAKGKSPRAENNSPNAPRLRKAVLSGFSPRSLLALGPRKFCAAYCSLGTMQLLEARFGPFRS